MNTMQFHLRTLLASLILMTFASYVQTVQAQQAQSDYEIVQNFNATYDSLRSSLDTVSTVDASKNLLDRIESLQQSYSKHSQLINKALYPETFKGQMNKLISQASSTVEKLKVIAKQQAKLKQLTGNVERFEKQLKKLRNRTDSLQNLLNQTEKKNRRLASSLRHYRNETEKRNKLVLSIIDSLIANYEKLDTQTLQELRTAYQKSRKTIDENALKLVETIARTHIEFLNSATTLGTEEYLRMYNVQQKFQKMWNRVGDELLSIYVPKGGSEAIRSEIKSAIDEWQTKIANQTWNSLNRSFSEANINVSEFGDQQSFYNSLTNYIDKQIKKGNRKTYKKFVNFWNNTVKSRWAQYLIGTNILQYQQIASIDQKLEQWEKKSAPVSYIWKILLGVAVLIIIVLGVMLARARSGTSET